MLSLASSRVKGSLGLNLQRTTIIMPKILWQWICLFISRRCRTIRTCRQIAKPLSCVGCKSNSLGGEREEPVESVGEVEVGERGRELVQRVIRNGNEERREEWRGEKERQGEEREEREWRGSGERERERERGTC